MILFVRKANQNYLPPKKLLEYNQRSTDDLFTITFLTLIRS